MGQVNLVRIGMNHVRDSGSFTLTGGALTHEPMAGGAAISMVNAGLEGFALGASIEMPRGLRVNVVSSPWIAEHGPFAGNHRGRLRQGVRGGDRGQNQRPDAGRAEVRLSDPSRRAALAAAGGRNSGTRLTR